MGARSPRARPRPRRPQSAARVPCHPQQFKFEEPAPQPGRHWSAQEWRHRAFHADSRRLGRLPRHGGNAVSMKCREPRVATDIDRAPRSAVAESVWCSHSARPLTPRPSSHHALRQRLRHTDRRRTSQARGGAAEDSEVWSFQATTCPPVRSLVGGGFPSLPCLRETPAECV